MKPGKLLCEFPRAKRMDSIRIPSAILEDGIFPNSISVKERPHQFHKREPASTVSGLLSPKELHPVLDKIPVSSSKPIYKLLLPIVNARVRATPRTSQYNEQSLPSIHQTSAKFSELLPPFSIRSKDFVRLYPPVIPTATFRPTKLPYFSTKKFPRT